mgnify:CR=1 FL=1
MKKQNKIYSISSGAFGYDDIHIKPEDIVIVWLDNYGFTHIFYCIMNKKFMIYFLLRNKCVSLYCK